MVNSEFCLESMNCEIPNSKQIQMTNDQTTKPEYDLEKRTFNFAKAGRQFVKTLPNTTSNLEDW